MAVSKSLRYQILRRDNHTCRYCGHSAPDVKLVVDHVLPETLGGRNEAENLITACADCNSGKAATPPDAALLADVERDAIRWKQAMRLAAESLAEEHWAAEQRNAGFRAEWESWTHGVMKKAIALPPDWAGALTSLRNAGLTDELISEAITIAMRAKNVEPGNTFRYFAGVCWRRVAQLQDRARAIANTLDEDY